MRPQQWSKNLFVFAGLIFAVRFNDISADLVALAAFCCFCALSSGVYLVNDIADCERDRKHPIKRNRPIASGQLSVATATLAAVVLCAGAVTAGFLVRISFGVFCTGYLVMMLAYSFALKHEVILDVFIIAAGFVIRALAGASAINVRVSPWLIVCTILLSLFLALCKRRAELIMLDTGAQKHRRTLEHYTVGFLDQMISVVTSATVVCYLLYAFQSDTAAQHGGLLLTVPFVLYGMFRYLYLVYTKDQGQNPEQMILSDRPLLVDLVLWAVVSGAVLWKL
ncbi:MAG: decaprenyl-phosphate phosphoribosyltransferase [Armatimonadetes bacterium]|nr:decaprenyl-phosphate phosphoribosyltransferase [Armatimonadota bacterium]